MAIKTKTTAAPESTEEVAVVQQATQEVGFAINFSEDAGSGLEDFQSSDLSLPFLTVLQKGSPQCDEMQRQSGKYIPDARPGMIMNTLTSELHRGDEGIIVVPCGYKKVAVEWKPRDSGGGLVGHHALTDPIVQGAKRNDKNQLVLPGGNILVETAYHFVLVLSAEGPTQAVLALSSTQLKKSRKWNTVMTGIRMKGSNGQMFQPAVYSHQYRITTCPESNAQGNWWGINIANEGMIQDSAIYALAKEFFSAVRNNAVKVSAPPVDHEGDPFGEPTSEDAPF
jgi:hypothetical protein